MHSSLYDDVSRERGQGVRILPSLCFYNPKEVYDALTRNKDVIRWLRFISNHYDPAPRQVLLIYPCSADKPYYLSRSYKTLFSTLSKLGEKRKSVHVATVSEPFGLIPEEFYTEKTEWHDWSGDWYDCPGLFEWWCKKYDQDYSKEYLEKSIDCLSDYLAMFFNKVKTRNKYSEIVAFVRTCSSSLEEKSDHTHRRIIEKAAKTAGVKVDILPKKRTVSRIVKKSGRLAWDLYGVAHPIAQQTLLSHLKGVLNRR